MPRYIPQRPYSDKYTGLPGMLSAIANEGEHFRLTKTSRLQNMEAREIVKNQHLIDHPAGKEGRHVTNQTMNEINRLLLRRCLHYRYGYVARL